ncbi:unnamed protein product [Polarella glacialis]|uniref:Major facilitator superfamily (MFS) profile domain-containing protein n=1 Tax=Polarella glacialis TaxID=89957 RepID=A0A813GKY1_POLGL|nr:unnamed protein product [Polarella glacialis]
MALAHREAPFSAAGEEEPSLLDPDALARKNQIRNTWIAAFSNLSTAYNLVNINLAHVCMENQYCGGDNCKNAVTAAGTACLVGAIFGQLTFGYVGDCLGRGRALQLTMVLSILGALVSGFAVPINSEDPSSVFTFLCISRFVLGIGVGGVYPLAATIAAESSASANRGRSVSIVFSMQGVGTLLVPLVGMVLLYSLGDDLHRRKNGLSIPGISWRLMLGLGALPGMILLRFKTSSAAETSPAASPRPAGQSLTLMQALGMKRYWPKLVGCAGGWFLFDITFYGNTLFAPTVLEDVFKSSTSGIPLTGKTLSTNLCWQLTLLALIGLPGYYVSVWQMDKLGRKNIQLQGFVMMAVLYGALGLWMDDLEGNAAVLMLIYGLTYFFSSFGPNSTTFILPSESFPREVRSSLNGFCAAMGKLGATVGSACFKPIISAAGTSAVFFLCAGCAALGVIVTVFFIDDLRGREMEGDGDDRETQSSRGCSRDVQSMDGVEAMRL